MMEGVEEKEVSQQKGKGSKRCVARCWHISERSSHEGKELLTEEAIRKALNGHRMIERWAYILHDKDIDAETGEAVSPHWHILFRVSNKNRALDVSEVARWFGIEEHYCEKVTRGEAGFCDVLAYLDHRHVAEKHHYDVTEIRSNFDVDELLASRPCTSSEEKEIMTRWYAALAEGKTTLDECRKENASLYGKYIQRLKAIVQDYRARRHQIFERTNIIISGAGGSGKSTLAEALARQLSEKLYPDVEHPIFVVGERNVTFQNYAGEPILIWEDQRSYDLRQMFGGQIGTVYEVFDPNPTADNKAMNVKNGMVVLNNEINIITTPQSVFEFLDNLAGEYVDKDGVRHKKEDKTQAYRRFQFLFKVDGDKDVYAFCANEAIVRIMNNQGFQRSDYMLFRTLLENQITPSRIYKELKSKEVNSRAIIESKPMIAACTCRKALACILRCIEQQRSERIDKEKIREVVCEVLEEKGLLSTESNQEVIDVMFSELPPYKIEASPTYFEDWKGEEEEFDLGGPKDKPLPF